MTVTEIAIKRSTLVVVIFAALTLLGVTSYTMLNYDLFPKMDIPIVVVVTQYPGASASEMESTVTKKIEDALASMENVKTMSSTSQESVSMIVVELYSGANTDLALQDAQRKVNSIMYNLPDDITTPALYTFSMDDMPILKAGVTANMDPRKLYTLVDNQIKSQLSKMEGVGQVTLIGGTEREIQVKVNKHKLDSYNLTISEVYSAISAANLEYPTGKIEGDTKQYTVRLGGKFTSLNEIRNLVIAQRADGEIKISDVAEVIDGTVEQTRISRVNGVTSIGLSIQKQSDANTVKVCSLLKAQMKVLEQRYADYGLKFTIASDNSEYTMASANAVMEDLLIAILLVAIIMFLFLHSLRNSLIVLISIPTSIISVFTAMYVFDFSLNMLTLMALSLVIGILVDDSIVVIENIYRHLEMGKDKVNASLDGRNEIGFTAVAITMVDVVVFLPLSMVSGMIGNMLREFSLVVVFSTLMSLFVSFTITPLLASRFGKIEKLSRNKLMGKIALGFEDLFKKLLVNYERTLRWGLAHRKTVFAAATILVLGSFSLVGLGFIGSEFITTGDRGEFMIRVEGEPQNTTYQTNKITQQIESYLMTLPDVTKIYTNVGYSSASGGLTAESNKSEITVSLVPKQDRKLSVEDYMVMIKKELLKIPGIKVTAAATSLTGNASSSPIQILLSGPDLDQVYNVADSVMGIVRTIPGTTDIELSVEKSRPELRIQLNREKMAKLGLSVYSVGTTLSVAFSGTSNLNYSDKSDDYNINVRFDEFNRKSVEDVGAITFKNSSGQLIELRQFADIFQSLGPNKLQRFNRISSIYVNSNVIGRPVGTVGEEIKAAVAKKIHNRDVSIEYKGNLERQSEAFGSLFLALGIAIILVYFIMVALYNSYLYPFVVLFSIPVAVIGALSALALAWQTLSVFSIIGMIMLIGLVAKNAILLVDFTNQLREEGKPVVEALVEAGKERMRPILMTTLAMVFGMLPIALASGEASEVKNGLAWAIIGGLTSSLLLTLVLVPSVYMTMENLKVKVQNKLAARRKKAEQTAMEA
jgi:HAE1 family hydrophobic/amphiphilic exporter-1